MWNFHQTIESALETHLPQCRRPAAKPLDDAVRYAIFPGGKRIRPMLSLLGARVFATDVRVALPAACAVEFIHASSLVFDDLPCMDDAQIRRGKCVVHKVFGEEIALLAALALLNQSYAILGKTRELIAEAAACIGVDGMIGGQALDLSASGPDGASPLERDERLAERNRKTSAMMRLALTAGALACGVHPRDAEFLGRAGQCLGEAFQIGDDLLDARRSNQHTGKDAGQDLRHSRPNHGGLDERAVLVRLQTMVADTRMGLTEAYGAERIAELMMFVDAMFAKLTAKEKIPVGGPTQ
jgi:geranylgeranyl diphosphate synthase type II